MPTIDELAPATSASDADEFIVEIISGFFLREDLGSHVSAGAAPGRITIHEDIFVFSFGLGPDGGPAQAVFEMYALGTGQEREQRQ